MRLIVGLGNPGPEYAWTPHNLGFLVVDRLAEAGRIRVERPEARAYIGRGQLVGQQVLLAKPQTFMNVSGLAVRELLGRFECDPAEMIAIYDDVALPWGYIRIRERGSAGGHNGLKSLIGALGSDEFVRVRLGVQPEHPVGDLAAYVLSPMSRDELEIAAEMVEQAAEAVQVILAEGVRRAMNRFNRRVPPAGEMRI
jgi:PTH1 family peptidyl-tRNA hydrolase